MVNYKSWAAFIVIIGAAVWYYRKPQSARTRGRSLSRASSSGTATRGDANWIEAESKPKAAPKAAKAKQPRKQVKKAVQEVKEKAETYLNYSGADGDDEPSPAVSPKLAAAAPVKAPSGKDVSDMLERRGSGPGVLKINASTQPARPSKPQQQRTESPQETKKQRQNRKKVEEAKAQREADEKQRKILLEQQRRTAREARGESAKNGLQSSKPPAKSAWESSRPAAEVVAAPAPRGPLLDTFDPDHVSTASSSEAGQTNGMSTTSGSLRSSNDWANGLSEEEQLRMALEETAWETVPKGRKQKKKVVEEPLEESVEASTPRESAPKPAPVKQAPAPKVENKAPQSRFGVLDETPIAEVGHDEDTEWGVV